MMKKLKHIAHKNFQTNCNKNDAAENIRLVGKPGSEAFSKGKSGHADKECDYGKHDQENNSICMTQRHSRLISQS